MAEKIKIIHPGKTKVTIPAPTELRYNQETGGFEEALVEGGEETVVETTVPKGTKIGDLVVGEVYELTAAEAKPYLERGFTEASAAKAKAAEKERIDPVLSNDAIAERDRAIIARKMGWDKPTVAAPAAATTKAETTKGGSE